MRKFPLLLLLLLIASCSTHRAVLNPDVKARARDYAFTTQFQTFFFYGIAQEEEVDLEAICGSGDKVHTFLVKDTFVDLLIRASIVYTPRAARVYCMAEPVKNIN